MNIEQVYKELIETKEKLNRLNRIVSERFNNQAVEIEQLESNIESAVVSAIHELIDYIRHNDIQALDEAEFDNRLRELLFKEPELPF